MNRPRREFALAPMSPLIFWLTAVLFLVPAGFTVAALASGNRFLWIPALGTAALYAAVWLACRPSRFMVSDSGLEVAFPAWTRSIPRSDVAGAREVPSGAFRTEFGGAVRLGVGGLWGGFGWLWTRRRGLIEFYISRTDGLILIERRFGKPLLVTPDDPAGLLRALED
jgi:hypothetical protein